MYKRQIYEELDHVLWNQYYTGGFSLKKKYVIRHFNETELFLVSQSLVSSLVMLFSKGKIPSFHNFFACVSSQKYKLFFDSFEDIRDNPVLSFVDFDRNLQKIAIKKVIHKKSRMPPPELEDWVRKEKMKRKSRRQQMKSLKQVKLHHKIKDRVNRVKSLKRDNPNSKEPNYSDLEQFYPKIMIKNKPFVSHPKDYSERMQKRFNYVKDRLSKNLFSTFLVGRFESLLDYAIIIIYGFLKDIVFAYYELRIQSTERLRELYDQNKLDHFKNLLELFFFMLKKNKSKIFLGKKINQKQNLEKQNSESPRKDSEKTAISENKSLPPLSTKTIFQSSIEEINTRKKKLFLKLDEFFGVCKRVMKEFLNKEIEFPNPHWEYLRYPVFKYVQKLSIIYCGGHLDEGKIFLNLAEILSNLEDIRFFNLGFSG